jgi:putative ABC transport system permease protein
MPASIGLRTREIGVRRALGASDAMATRMLLVQGARQLGVGTLIAAPVLLVIGVAAASLFPLGAGVTAAAGVLVSAAIVAVVLAATWLPTRRVLRVPLRDAIWKE